MILCAIGTVAALGAMRVTLDGSYLALLPADDAQVRELRAVLREAGGAGELVLAVSTAAAKPTDAVTKSARRAAELRFARRLARTLEQRKLVAWAAAELPVSFIEKRKLLLMPRATLAKLRREADRAVRKARAKVNPMVVDLDDDDDNDKKKAAAGKTTKRDPWGSLRALERKHAAALPKRVLRSSDGRFLFVVAKPLAASTELSGGQRVLDGIKVAVASLAPERSGLRVQLAGSLVEQQHQHRAMQRDMGRATVVALALVVLLITVFTRRLGAVVVVGLPLLLGVAATLAVTALLIGHLNVVSGFLVAALVGLGIDFGVHLFLRYLDELPAGEAAAAELASRVAAMRRAVAATFGACATGAATTAVAFLALRIADFRGFSEYGLVAAIGVVLTLAATFVALPPLALLLVRRGRSAPAREPRRLRRALAWSMVVVAVAFAALSAARLSEVRFRNDFKALQGKVAGLEFADYVARELGGSLAPAILMVDSLEQARRAAAMLRARIDAAAKRRDGSRASAAAGGKAAGTAMIRRVLTLADIVPAPVAAKARRRELVALSAVLARVKARRLAPADRDKLEELRRLAAAQPWGLADVPAGLRQRFVSAGGKHFVLVWAAGNMRTDRDLRAWSRELGAALGALRAAGIGVLALDENRIAARVLDLVAVDGPRVLVAASLAVLAVLLIYFRRPEDVLLVAGSLALGLVGLLGVMAFAGVELNLFNIVVLPTILGVGIDNAVHVRHAHKRAGPGSIPTVIAGCGRAALLSSATTAIGFGAAILAHHAGIASLGVLALLGVACAFIGSTVALPALLALVDEGRARAAEGAGGSDGAVSAADLAAENALAHAATSPVPTASSTWRR